MHTAHSQHCALAPWTSFSGNYAVQGKAAFAAKAQPHRRAEVEDVLQAIEDQKQGKAIILDARSQGQYTGEVCCDPFCVVHAMQH